MSSPLFGRLANGDALADAVSDLLSGDMAVRALARNLMHDHRVSDTRAKMLRTFLPSPVNSASIEPTLVGYFQKRVRTASTPDFLNDDLNGDNIIAGRQTGEHVVSKDVELARVLDLSGLRRFYLWARGRHEPEFLTLPDSVRQFDDWLDAKLERSTSDLEPFLERVLTLLRDYQLEEPFEPCWATTWTSLERGLDDGPNRWLELVGVPPGDGNRWIVVLRYKVRDVGTLVRPTQLDAGWYCFHFPIPPMVPLSTGGHPMDVGDDTRAPQLIPEYIHEQIRHTIDQWRAGGRRLAKTYAPATTPFDQQRKRHWVLLHSEYNIQPGTWMPDPV